MKQKSKTAKPNKENSLKKTAEVFQITLTPGTVFEVKPNHKYFVVLRGDQDKFNKRDLSGLNVALQKLFGDNKVLAIFADELEVKLLEMQEGDSNVS